MYCQKCGKEISDDAAVCGYCGAATESQGSDNFDGEVNAWDEKKIKIKILIICLIIFVISVVITNRLSYLHSNEYRIIGKWDIDYVTYKWMETSYLGYDSGKYDFSNEWVSDTFPSTLNDDVITMEFKRNGSYIYEYGNESGVLMRKEGTYTINNDILIINGGSIMSEADSSSNSYTISVLKNDLLILNWKSGDISFEAPFDKLN